MTIPFWIFSLLLGLAVPVTIIVVVVLLVRRGQAGAAQPTWSLRRFLQYGFLLIALFTLAVGLTRLLRVAVPDAERLVGRATDELALGLSLTLVAGPFWAVLWRLVRRKLTTDAEERGAASWPLYLAAASTVSLVVAFVGWVGVGAWVVGLERFEVERLAAAVVWTGVWALHAWFARDHALAPTGRLAPLAVLLGSAVGVVALAGGAGGLFVFGFDALYQAAFGGGLVVQTAELWRMSLVFVVLAAPVWWWHWLRDAARAPRTGLWHAYVMLVPVLGGLLTGTSAVAVLVHTGLQWFVGVPAADGAALHFEPVPGALAAGVVGAWLWWYHRAVLGWEHDRERTEPERIYTYLVAAVGLLAAAGGLTVAIVAAIEALGPAPLATIDPQGRNTLVMALALLVVGGPLWAVFWRAAQRRAETEGTAELRSPARRSYLFLLFGATGLTAFISLTVILFVFFRDALDQSLGATTLVDLRAAIALVLTAGGLSAYHWMVHRSDRSRLPVEAPPHPRHILLLSGDGQLASELALRTGATVRALRRLDTEGPGPDVDTVVQAVLVSPSEQLLVLVEPDGTINAVPYTS